MSNASKTSTAASMESQVNQEMFPCCDVALWWHDLQMAEDDASREEAREKLMAQIKKNGMSSLYTKAVEKFGWTLDEKLQKSMTAAHVVELTEFDAKIEEARENYGDQEVRDALLNKANFYCKIGDLPNAIAAYQVAYEKTVGVGSRLDITLTLIRVGFVHGDKDIIKQHIIRAKEEMEKGGDWERRNKLKVFEGLELITERKFDAASALFLGVLPAFSATPLLSFERFVFYAALLALLCCTREQLKTQVVSAPSVLEAGDKDLRELLSTFYKCQYREFMTVLVTIAHRVQKDVYMGRHYLFFIRCIRLRAYRQFLEPYKSVTIKSMAEAFGVSSFFIEDELAGFIASGKLNCRIDRVNGVVESNRPDERSRLYLQTIKEGDVLMNRIQKLARVIAL